MEVCHLRVNHQDRPVIDSAPEFSFHILSEKKGVMLGGYRIQVKSGAETFWDSGTVASDRNAFIRYAGKTLRSGKEYVYTVTAWDLDGDNAEASSTFTTGLYTEDWKAAWIGCPFERNEHHMLSDGIINPVLQFSRTFIAKKHVSHAKLYATCLGVYRPLMNGKRIDEREFAPEFTSYSGVLYYQTYDATPLLRDGKNELAFIVGDGWYFNQQTAAVRTDVKKPAILFQLELEYEDGDRETIFSDGTETCRETNILYSDLFVGEKVDLTADYSEERHVEKIGGGYDTLCAQKMEPVTVSEIFRPVRIFRSPKGELIIDFGQVIAGRCRIRLHAEKGTEVILEHTEVLDREGNYFAALQARQRDIIICSGEEILYEPVFTFHGFRYVRITGLDGIREDEITAVLYTTEKENAGEFSCSDERLERLYRNIRYSQKNNMLSIPTDCPQREKAGWTGDVLIYGKTSMLNECMIPFYRSWLNSLRNDQYKNGAVPIVSPYTKLYEFVVAKTMKDFDDSKPTGILENMLPKGNEAAPEDRMAGVAGWSDVIVWLPYDLYRVSGDTDILREYYGPMKKWVDHIIFTAASRRNERVKDPEADRYLWNTGFHFGEWLVYGHNVPGFEITKETSWYTAPMFGYRTIQLFCEISELLGMGDTEYYRQILEKMKAAIQREVLSVSDEYDHYMGRYVLALAFGLAEGKLRERYAVTLVRLIEENGGRLATGFLATPFILDALDEIGGHDLAKGILMSEEMPSWLYEVRMGGTTIWENWNAVEPDGTPHETSFDHYAFGVVDDYLFRKVCGISGDAGFRNIEIRPDTGYGFRYLKRAFLSENGWIRMEVRGGKLSVSIPCNTRAKIWWNGSCYEIGSGEYQW